MDHRLLDILVCPVTKGPLIYDKEHHELISKSARLAYPIRDGIPVMLESEARALEPEFAAAGEPTHTSPILPAAPPPDDAT